MSVEQVELFTNTIDFGKIPTAVRKNLRAKLENWFVDQKQKGTLPFDRQEYESNEIHLESDTFLFYANFGKVMRVITGVQNPETNLEKLNEVANKIFSYFNTIMPDKYKKSNFVTQFTLYEDEGKAITKTVVVDSQIARISELIKAQVKPIGFMFEWKDGERNLTAVEAYVTKNAVLTVTARNSLKGDIPMDCILHEKEILLKCKKVIKQMTKRES